MPKGQTMGSRRRSLTVRIAPQSPFLTSPLRCTHGYPRYPLSGITACTPRSHPLTERGSNSPFDMNSCAYVAANFRNDQSDYRGGRTHLLIGKQVEVSWAEMITMGGDSGKF